MIDFAKTRSPLRSATSSKNRAFDSEELLADSPHGTNVSSEFANRARRLIAEKPAVCVTAAFVLGGIIGWLTSKR